MGDEEFFPGRIHRGKCRNRTGWTLDASLSAPGPQDIDLGGLYHDARGAQKIARDERAYRYACQLLGDGKVKNLKVEGEHSFSAQVEDAPYTYAVTATFTGGAFRLHLYLQNARGAPPRLRRTSARFVWKLSREGRTQVLLSKARRENAVQVLSWFETPAAREPSLKLLCTVEIPEEKSAAAGLLFLRVGQKRMYVVQDLSTFVKSYAAGEEIPFGKGLSVEPQWQCFNPAQERLLRYLLELITSREMALGKPVLRERQFLLTNEQLRRVFQMLAQSISSSPWKAKRQPCAAFSRSASRRCFRCVRRARSWNWKRVCPPTASSSRARDNLSG